MNQQNYNGNNLEFDYSKDSFVTEQKIEPNFDSNENIVSDKINNYDSLSTEILSNDNTSKPQRIIIHGSVVNE